MKPKKTIKNQKGAAIVEFAIVLPLLLLLFIGICEFGLLWYNSQVIINASREGARAGIAREADSTDETTNAGIKWIVDNYCASRLVGFGSSSLDPPIYPLGPNIGKDFGEDFVVEVRYNYNFLVPSLFHLGLTKIIVGRTLMKMEMILGP